MCNCIVRSIGSSSIYILDIIGVVIYWKSKMLSLGAFSQKFLLPNYLTTRYIFLEKYLGVGGVVIRAENWREPRYIYKHLLIHGTSNTYENQFTRWFTVQKGFPPPPNDPAAGFWPVYSGVVWQKKWCFRMMKEY